MAVTWILTLYHLSADIAPTAGMPPAGLVQAEFPHTW
jgi:hypothetical protein